MAATALKRRPWVFPTLWILRTTSFVPIVNMFAPVVNRKNNRQSYLDSGNIKLPERSSFATILVSEKYAVNGDQIDSSQSTTPLLETYNDSPSKTNEITAALDRVSGTSPGFIIPPYKPQRWWLWTRWKGTVLKETLPTVAINMLVTLAICLSIRRVTNESWALGTKPDPTNFIIARLGVFVQVWRYLMTLTTFVLTFFLGEAFLLWKHIYTIGRQVQGRLNDLSILIATHAKRQSSDNTYTEESQDFLHTVARHIRLFHVLMWASYARDYTALLSNEGMNQMVDRKMLTREEASTLVGLDLPATQRHNAVLEWIVIRIQAARRKGLLENAGVGFEHVFLDKVCTLRGTFATISDVLDGRMPLCYTHMVQVLVDGFLFCAPLALFAELGVWSVLSVGFLTFFYSGMLDLAKVFLDPLANEDYAYSQDSAVKVDLSVLMRETNAGSVRWKNGAATLPSSVL